MSKSIFIDFSEIESIPQLIKDYLAPGSELGSGIVFSRENFERQIAAKRENFSAGRRAVLADVLKEQYAGLSLNPLQQSNLQALEHEDTFTVVTGHQLNLFTGPAFFIYKIMQTVKTAVWLNENFPEIHVVPMFWMATEDHDFEEINHFKTPENYYEMSAKSGGAVGRIIIEDTGFIVGFAAEFGDAVYGTELIRWIREAYVPGRTLAAATRILVNRMFADSGLLIVDGDDFRLKKQMSATFSEELQHYQLWKSTEKAVSMLKDRYGKVQVNPRKINLFYLNAQRERIDPDGNDFILAESGQKFTKENLLRELQNHPENFSPNALMRPVYQESVLPNLAYIGGNAEVMYWVELREYFQHLGLPFPVLVPRNSFLFLSEKTFQKIERSGLPLIHFLSGFRTMLNDLILKESSLTHEISGAEVAVKKAFDTLKNLAGITDKTFYNLVEAEQTRQLKSYEKMRKRLLRAEKIRHAERIAVLENLYAEIHPQNIWQERVLNFSSFYEDLGQDWFQKCLQNTSVEKSGLIISVL